MKNLCTTCDFQALGRKHETGDKYCMINPANPVVLTRPYETCPTYSKRAGDLLTVGEYQSWRGNRYFGTRGRKNA